MIVRSKAPLRLGLAGGGTDVSPYSDLYGGFVLNATIDMYAHCTIEATDDRQITIIAEDKDRYQGPASPHLDIDGRLSLQMGVYNRVCEQFNGGKPLSFKMTTYSDALAGSGLGSSSTMVVAVLTAFVEWLNLPLGEYDIANLAYQIERSDLGFSGGKQDQYAATFGGFNFMEFYEQNRVVVNPLRIKNWIVNELESSTVLYFTGISRDSAKIIDEQTSNVQEKKTASIEAMHQLKSDSLALKEALLRGEIRQFAEIVGHSWEAKKVMAHSITNDQIDFTYRAALDAGAISGKITGAGGGGFMMLFTDPTQKPQLVKRLSELSGQVWNFHFTKQGTQSWTIH